MTKLRSFVGHFYIIMWSFKYPDQILHKTTEKEWFPRSRDHKESRCVQPDSCQSSPLAALLQRELSSLMKPHTTCTHSFPFVSLRLDSLEREEEAFQTQIRKIAQAKAKQPIGVSTKTKPGAAAASVTTTQVDMSVIEPQPRPRLWNNLSAPETPQSEAQSMMLDDSTSLADSSVNFSP